MNLFSRTLCRLFRPAFYHEYSRHQAGSPSQPAPILHPPSPALSPPIGASQDITQVDCPIRPSVVGIACTDPEGHLFHTEENGTKALITQAPGVPPMIRTLDFHYLKHFLAVTLGNHSLVVVGRHTWHQMRSLLGLYRSKHPHLCLLVADATGIYRPELQELKTLHTFQSSDTLQELRLFALREAYAHGRDIAVLGGRSVYNSFAEYYDEFHACLVFPHQGDYVGGGRISIPRLLVNQPDRSNRYHPKEFEMTQPIHEALHYEVRHFTRG